MRVVGLMSGTSLDAIDVAVVDLELRGPTLEAVLVGWAEEPWPAALRERIRGWSDPLATVAVEDIAAASMEIGAVFAEAASRGAASAGVAMAAVDLVASHGQTVHHRVDDDGRAVATLQLGEPAVIAEQTGCTVVADFRPRDICAGGQGAPLVSFVDALLFGEADRTVAALNLGGIANVTVIPAGEPFAAVAFDTGPANSLIDGAARTLVGQTFDLDGAIAGGGRPSKALLEELLAEPYFQRAPPKSTGRELFGDEFVARVVVRARALDLRADDVLATLTELSAWSVARAMARWAPAWPEVLHVSGGGTRNATLMAALGLALAREAPDGGGRPIIRSVDEAGMPSGAKEAFAFAILGHEALHGRLNSLPGATGARHASVLGAIWPAANYARLVRLVSQAGDMQRIDRIVLRRWVADPTSSS